MYTFTREFCHPVDRVPMAAPAARERFFQDNKRFPPDSYSDSSLLWKGDQWRQPCPVERASLMGIPAGLVRDIPREQAIEPRKTAIGNCLIGNSFHVPSLMLVLIILFQAQSAVTSTPVSFPMRSDEEHALKVRIAGTIFEPGRLEKVPGLWSPNIL